MRCSDRIDNFLDKHSEKKKGSVNPRGLQINQGKALRLKL